MLKKFITNSMVVLIAVGNTDFFKILSNASSYTDGLYYLSEIDDSLNDGPSDIIPEFKPDVLLDFNVVLQELDTLLIQYKSSKDVEILKKCVLDFGKIPKISKSISNDTIKNSLELEILFNSIRNECYTLETIDEQEYFVKMFAEEIFLGWKYDKNIEHFKDHFLINGLINYNKNRLINIQERLDYLTYVIEFYNKYGDPYPEQNIIPEVSMPPGNPEDYPEDPPINFPFDEPDDDFHEDIEVIGPNYGGNTSGPDYGTIDDNIIKEEDLSSVSYYKGVGDKCYKVTESYKDNMITKTDTIEVDKSEYVYCGIYEYSDFGDGYSSGHTEIDKEYISNNQNESSSYMVYYTVTNNKKAPYYYNTGIRAEENSKTISYNQLRDAFYQLAIKNKSFTADANDKSLYIFDGKPLVLRKTIDDAYSQTDINRLLNPFEELGIKIMKNEEYLNCQLRYEELKEKEQKVFIDDIIIDSSSALEKNIAWIEDDVIKIHIDTLALLLSANVEYNGKELIITKDSSLITVNHDEKEYTTNGKTNNFLTKATFDGTHMISEIGDIPKSLGYNIEFDKNNNILIFNKIK